MSTPTARFLCPDGYAAPAAHLLARELGVVPEAGRFVLRTLTDRRRSLETPYAHRAPVRAVEPVVLVPGFMAGDTTLRLLARRLRQQGFRTYRSHIHANVGCTQNAAAQLERRLESIAQRRDSRVRIVGHSLGGLIARGLAVRRPDLVSGIVTMGSPMLAPGAHHALLSASLETLVRLTRAGVPGLMSEDCVNGECARMSWEDVRRPVPRGVDFTAIYSRNDGIVDWRACIDPVAHPVEVTASHIGMAVDPRVMDQVVGALTAQGEAAVQRSARLRLSAG